MHGFQRSTFDREHQEEEAEAERVRLVQAEAARRRQNQPRDPQGPIDWRGIAKHLAQNREHQEEEEEAERVRIYTFMQCAPKFLCVFVVDRPPNTAGVLSYASSDPISSKDTKSMGDGGSSRHTHWADPSVSGPLNSAIESSCLGWLVLRVRVQLIRHVKTCCTTEIYIQHGCAHVGLSVHAPVDK